MCESHSDFDFGFSFSSMTFNFPGLALGIKSDYPLIAISLEKRSEIVSLIWKTLLSHLRS